MNSSQDWDKEFKRIILGNKIDLEEKRVINKDRIDLFSEKENIQCFETSAKDGINVDVIFQKIGELILANKTEEGIREEYIIRLHSTSTLSKDSNYEEIKKRRCCWLL